MSRGVFGNRAFDPVLPNLLFSFTQIVLHVCFPQLLVQLVCKELGLDGLECDSTEVSKQASLVSLCSSFVIALPGLFMIGFYGKFADSYGLKMTLLCPVIGNFLFLLCMFLALCYPATYFPILMMGSAISGFSGSRGSFIMASFTYAAELSSSEERSDVFSVIESGIYCARIIGPLVVGEVTKNYGFMVAVGVGMTVCVLDFIWIITTMDNFTTGHNHTHHSHHHDERHPSKLLDDDHLAINHSHHRHHLNVSSANATIAQPLLASTYNQLNAVTKSYHTNGPPTTTSNSSGGAASSSSGSSGGVQLSPSTSITITTPALAYGPTDFNNQTIHVKGITPVRGQAQGQGLDIQSINKDLLDREGDDESGEGMGCGSGSLRLSLPPTLSYDPLVTFKTVAQLFGEGHMGNDTVPYLATAYFLFYMASLGELLIEILFQKKVFHFSTEVIGYYGGLSGMINVLSMVALPRVIHAACGGWDLLDVTWVEIGLWSRVLYYVLFSMATQWFHLFFLLPLLLFSGAIVPRARSYLSKSVAPQDQTKVFVAIAALEAIGSLFSPLFSAGYYQTVSFFPGMMFLSVALICLSSAIIVSSIAHSHNHNHNHNHTHTDEGLP